MFGAASFVCCMHCQRILSAAARSLRSLTIIDRAIHMKMAAMSGSGNPPTTTMPKPSVTMKWSAPTIAAPIASTIVTEAMEGAAELRVRLLAEAGTGRNWLEAH